MKFGDLGSRIKRGRTVSKSFSIEKRPVWGASDPICLLIMLGPENEAHQLQPTIRCG